MIQAALLLSLLAAASGGAPAPLTVSGRVLDPQGRPAAGAAVHLIAFRKFGPRDETTGPDGRFSFPVREGGIYRLSAEKTGYGGVRRPEPLRVRTAATSESPEIVLRLHRPALLSGRFLGLPDKDLRDADLTLDGGHVGATGRIAVAAGRYRISDLPPGHWHLRVEAGGRTTDATVLLAEGEARHLDLVFPRLISVRGRVVGPDGAPIPGAQIDLPGASYDQGGAETGPDGRFLAQAPLESHAAWARAPGFAPGSVPVELSNGPIEGVEIRLSRGAALSGRLLGLHDPDCKLDLFVSGPGPFVSFGKVDAPGHYTATSLGPGAWNIEAACGDQSTARTLTIPPGEAAPRLDLDFGPGPFTLTGRLLGEPGARYELTLERDFAPSFVARVEVASDGSFRFPGLQAGGYQIFVHEMDLPGDSLFRPSPPPPGEEVFRFDGPDVGSESIDTVDFEVVADRSLTLDVRGKAAAVD